MSATRFSTSTLRFRPLVVMLGLALVSMSRMPAALAGDGLSAVAVTEVEASPTGRYLVRFEESGLAAYAGDLPGFAATAPPRFPLVAGKLDVESAAARAYSAHLASRRDEHLARIEQALGRNVATVFRYEVTYHGISVALSQEEANVVAALPGVLRVSPVRVDQPTMYRGPHFIHADRIWDGSAVPAYATATMGQGIRIGVIDTGVDGAHPSFADDAVCGFGAGVPKLVARDCTVNDGIACTGNNPAPETGLGHGMHVASTAAGNFVDATATPAPLLPDGWWLSGVAPCAAVVSYKACIESGCHDDMLEAAVQNAVADNVDVVNYSVGPGCGGGNPWQDSPDFQGAAAAGLAVVAAAGNTAPSCPDPTGLATNLGPWLTTVAASSHDFYLGPTLSVVAPGEPPASLQDIILTPGSTTLPSARTIDRLNTPLRVYGANPQGCTVAGGFPRNFFTNAIAVVRRGDCSFSEKIANAVQAGAGLTVVVNNVAGDFSMDTTGAPATAGAFSIGALEVSDALLDFLGEHVSPPVDALLIDGFEPPTSVAADADAEAGAAGDYRRQAMVGRQGDILASFSLRGPVPAPLDNLPKPDVTAPGVGIYAAVDPASGDYGINSGTSMASPHVAGATALLRSLHPDWSTDELKSVLMTTAVTAGTREDGVTPWTPDDVGSGRVDLARAAIAGLTFHETQARYLAANPAGGSIGIEELNLPALRDVRCGERCSWTRTVRNRLDRAGTWTAAFEHPAAYTLNAEPATFTLAPGQTQMITITSTLNDVTLPAGVSYGQLRLSEHDGLSPDQALPAVVRGDEVSVMCVGEHCNFKVDNFTSGYSAVGCETFCSFLWANRFSPPADAFPITLTSVSFLTGSSSYVVADDRFDIYVYQDDDRDPTNGAALVGSHKGYAVATAGARLRTVSLASPIVLNGPGDVVIALANPSGAGPRPAAGEVSRFRGRSYVGNYVGEDPAIGSGAVDLKLNPDAIGSTANWVIRAIGTSAQGKAIELGDVVRDPVAR